MALVWRLRNARLYDRVNASTNVCAKVNAGLLRSCLAHIHPNRPQVSDNVRLFCMAATKQAQHTA
jgi:hypothetical protein